MASIFSLDGFNVEYSITTGEPQEVEIHGQVIYRSKLEAERTRPPNNVAVDTNGWEKRLADQLVRRKINVNRGSGYHAVTCWLADKGLLKLE